MQELSRLEIAKIENLKAQTKLFKLQSRTAFFTFWFGMIIVPILGLGYKLLGN